MTERKLATIRYIKEILPIENADNIELVKIDGWQCVARKGEFKINDICVYFEIDSLLPLIPIFDFMKPRGIKKNADGSEGYRLRTIKLKGKLSQGLALPIRFYELKELNLQDGIDVTEILGIKLYEPPIPACLSGKVKGLFPSFLKRTDAERVQNLFEEYSAKYKDLLFEETEKLDGTSCTVYYKDGVVGVCSRNMEFKEDDESVYSRVVKQQGLKEKLLNLKMNIALQGEIVGEGIQGNPLKLKGQNFYLFNIYDIDRQRDLTPSERYMIESENELLTVPTIDICLLAFSRFKTCDNCLEHVKGKSELNNNCEREGSVFKSTTLVDGQVIVFKAINNNYLLEEK